MWFKNVSYSVLRPYWVNLRFLPFFGKGLSVEDLENMEFFIFSGLVDQNGSFNGSKQTIITQRISKVLDFDQIFAKCSLEYQFHMPKFGLLTPSFRDRVDLVPFCCLFFESGILNSDTEKKCKNFKMDGFWAIWKFSKNGKKIWDILIFSQSVCCVPSFFRCQRNDYLPRCANLWGSALACLTVPHHFSFIFLIVNPMLNDV